MITRWAVRWLTWRLRKDKGFYIAYQANIAMAFYDEMSARYPQFHNNPSYDFLPTCNKAADRFMQQWIKR